MQGSDGGCREKSRPGEPPPTLGAADKVIELRLEAAKEGGSFLVIYAPDKLTSDGAMNVIQCVHFEFAYRYHRFAVEELK